MQLFVPQSLVMKYNHMEIHLFVYIVLILIQYQNMYIFLSSPYIDNTLNKHSKMTIK